MGRVGGVVIGVGAEYPVRDQRTLLGWLTARARSVFLPERLVADSVVLSLGRVGHLPEESPDTFQHSDDLGLDVAGASWEQLIVDF